MTGLAVTLSLSNSTTQDVSYANFGTYGVAMSYTGGGAAAHGDTLTAAAHNGKTITLTCNGHTAQTSALTVGAGGGSSQKGGSSSSDSSSRSRSGTTSQTPPQVTSLDDKPVGTLNNAIGQAAEGSGGNILDVKLKNISEITLKNVAEIIKKAKELGVKARVSSDTLSEDGKAVEVRVTLDPEQITETVKLDGYVRKSETRAVENTFKKYFENQTAVIRLGQEGEFGQTAKVAAKLDLTGFDTENLYIYRYDKQTNTYSLINTPYRIDANGYLHFHTDIGGFIVVSDGELEKK